MDTWLGEGGVGLKEWIVQLAGTSVLMGMLEILLPSGSMKKYLRLFMSLAVMLVVVQPLVNFSISQEKWDKIMSDSTVLATNDYDVNSVDKILKSQVNSMFKEKLQREIKSKIEKNFGDVDVLVDIFLIDKSSSLGTISRVAITISKKNEVDDLEKLKSRIIQLLNIEFGIDENLVNFIN